MLLTKKYLVGHFLVLLIVITCIFLSFWQFSRLSEKRELNTKITEGMSGSIYSYDDLTTTYDEGFCVECIQYRRAELNGKFNSDGEVLISGRSRDGEPGYNVATPIVLAGERQNQDEISVYVNRGWIPQPLGDAINDGSQNREIIEPLGGYDSEQTVVGFVRKNEPKSLFGSDIKVSKDSRVSPRLSSELFTELIETGTIEEEFYVQLSYSVLDGQKVTNEARDEYPIALEKPELSEGSHFSYAVQWGLFALIAAGTWGVVCFKATKKGRSKV